MLFDIFKDNKNKTLHFSAIRLKEINLIFVENDKGDL